MSPNNDSNEGGDEDDEYDNDDGNGNDDEDDTNYDGMMYMCDLAWQSRRDVTTTNLVYYVAWDTDERVHCGRLWSW